MLQPDAAKPGLWINPAWTPGTPGTFALIAGVSTYPHLNGSQQCFGLNSLFVSAYTASRFFDWLANLYSVSGCPLATCRLLLAPAAMETALGGTLAGPHLEPTFNNLDQAIGEWFADMQALPQAAAAQSRSVFFFSGHGLEIMEDRQILLPSDYLRPPTRTLDRAVSTQNIARGLKGLQVPLHFLFLDACRNDHNNLGNATPLEGTRILNEPSNRAVNQDAFVPIFYGSAAGSQAFQPNDPGRGPSLFGDALIEGLEAKGLTPDCSAGACRIVLSLLLPFVDRRVRDIAKTRFGEETAQRVRVRGDQTSEPVTEVPAPAPPAPPAPPPPSAIFREGQTGAPSPAPAMQPVRMRAVRPATANFGDLHDIFGSENVTTIWHDTARVRELGSAGWLVAGDDLEIDRVERTESTSSFRLDLRIPGAVPGRTYWLEIRDNLQTYACVLPVDSPDTRFQFEMDFRFDPRSFQRLDVTLSQNNPDPLARAARLWQTYDSIGADAAVREAPDAPSGTGRMEEVSAVAAAISGLVLLRLQSWNRLGHWLGELSHIAPQLPDASVLWTEQLLRDPSLRDEEAALESFLRLRNARLPFFAESLGYALGQAERFLAAGVTSPSKRIFLKIILQRLQVAVARLRPGGLFATFYGAAEQITPRLIEH